MYFIEIVDVGGKQKHENSRNVFYTHVNGCPLYLYNLLNVAGLILVHDLSNKNSYNKLKFWIAEVLEKINGSNSMKWKNVTEDMEEGGADLLELQVDGGYLPVLIIGAKVDLIEKNPLQKHQMHLAETGRSSVYVVSVLSLPIQ